MNPYIGRSNPKGWPHHPWFFININKADYGMPFSVSGFKQMWIRAKKRIGLKGKRLGRHSLRHLFGFYCANVLGLSLVEVQTLMHHSDPSSTRTYFSLSLKNVRQKLVDAFNDNPTALAVLKIAKDFKFKIPRSWF